MKILSLENISSEIQSKEDEFNTMWVFKNFGLQLLSHQHCNQGHAYQDMTAMLSIQLRRNISAKESLMKLLIQYFNPHSNKFCKECAFKNYNLETKKVVKFPPCLVISVRELDKPEPDMSMMPLTAYDETLELSQYGDSDYLEKGQKVEYELSAMISKPVGKMKKDLTYTAFVKTTIQRSTVWVKLDIDC